MQQSTTAQMPVFNLKHQHIEGVELYIQAPDLKSARQWYDDNIASGKVSVREAEPQLMDGNEVGLLKKNDILEDIISADNQDTLDIYDKGYDYDTDAYIFSSIKVTERQFCGAAETANELVECYWRGGVPVSHESVTSQLYASGEDRKVTIDGDTMDIYGEDHLASHLRGKYPDGLTIRLQDESLANLIEYRMHNPDNDMIKLLGAIEMDPDSRMLMAHGDLKAELRIKPEDYDLIYPCDETYYMEELSELGLDTGINAVSVMFNTEEDEMLKDARVETFVHASTLANLYIEGRPYHEVMVMVDKFKLEGVADRNLKYCIDWDNMQQQPEWKRQMAEEQTRPSMQKFWVEKLGPAYREKKEQYSQACETAAVENGWKNAAEWQKDVQWTKNPAPEMADRFYNASKRFSELTAVIDARVRAVEEDCEILKMNEMTTFVRQFDQASKKMTDVRIIPQMKDEWAVRCKIDGIQQSGRKLSEQDSKYVTSTDRPQGIFRELAVKYFRQDIADLITRQQDRGMKR